MIIQKNHPAMRKFIICAVFHAILLLTGGLSAQEDPAVIDSLRREVTLSRTLADSVNAMCNLYDVLPTEEAVPLGYEIIELAARAGLTTEAFDLIRNQADINLRDENVLKAMYDRAMKFPDSEERKHTVTFIRILQNIRKARYGDRDDRMEMLKEFLQRLELDPPKSTYERVWLLHGICMALSQETGGEMLETYLDSLTAMTALLPASAVAIRNAIGVHSAMAYQETNPAKAIECDRQMLSSIATLENYFHDKGRKYRRHTPYYYTVYTRMLSNFAALNAADVETYYAKVKECVAEDDGVRERYESLPAADIYYALSKKDYKTALPLLKKYTPAVKSNVVRRTLQSYLMRVAEEVGDKETQRIAATEYAKLLENELEDMAKGFSRDLQMAYAVHNIRSEIDMKQIESKNAEAAFQRNVIIASLVALLVLVTLLVIVFKLYRDNKRLVMHLAERNAALNIESENLKMSRADLIKARNIAQKANNLKSDFIKNMSYEVKVPLQAINEYSHLIADCVSETGQKHLGEFAALMELNSDLLNTIINDVLSLSEIESESLPIKSQVVNLERVLHGTVESVRKRVHPDVTLTLVKHKDRMDIFTDPTRVQQILNSILINAAKFTSKGSITVDYKLISDGSKVEIAVTDTGIGINPDNKERIFERFVKLDRDSQGAGLGLTIARQLARKMGGDVVLDTSWKDGSRFIVILPKN